MYREFFDKKFWKFIAVGLANTFLSALLMFILYDSGGMGYWGSSVVSYIVGSILSFFLNKNFTFKNKDNLVRTGAKFTLNVALCYVLAYGMAKPIVKLLLDYLSVTMHTKIVDYIGMLVGMALFTLLNYMGQRYFTFKEER